MTKYCKECGAPNDDDARFCEECGARLEMGIPEDARGKKDIGSILSEALDTISANPIIIVPYLAVMALSLIGKIVTWGQVVAPMRGLRDVSDVTSYDWEIYWKNAMAAAGVSSVIGIISWIVGIVAAAFAIHMTYRAVQGERVDLNETWNAIKGKLLIVIIATIIAGILTFLGVFALCIGAIIVAILLIFVKQGIIIDDLDIGGTFRNSYHMAKDNFLDIVIIGIVYIVLGIIVGIIPYLNAILMPFVELYSTVAFTILYLSRKQ